MIALLFVDALLEMFRLFGQVALTAPQWNRSRMDKMGSKSGGSDLLCFRCLAA